MVSILSLTDVAFSPSGSLISLFRPPIHLPPLNTYRSLRAKEYMTTSSNNHLELEPELS